MLKLPVDNWNHFVQFFQILIDNSLSILLIIFPYFPNHLHEFLHMLKLPVDNWNHFVQFL